MANRPRFDSSVYFAFQEALLAVVVACFTKVEGPKKRKTGRKGSARTSKLTGQTAAVKESPSTENLVAELGDFVEYLAEDIFAALPNELQTISYSAVQNDPILQEKYGLPFGSAQITALKDLLSPSTCDALQSYGLIATDPMTLDRFVDNVFGQFIVNATAAPHEFTPEDASSRPAGCEICSREQLPLTYHHLVPRAVHSKAVKRGWHRDWELNKVAWLCRACHSFVHKIETNETLGRDFHTVELLLARDDVQRWAAWVSNVRWRCK